MTFAVQDFEKPTADPEYQYFARNVVNFVSESVEGYNFNFPLNSITFITTYYRTRYTQYQSATDNLSVKPETTIYFEDGTINKCPIRIFPILLNVKVAPTAYTILSQYAPGVSFDIFTAPISTYRLLWNITAQVYIIAIFFGGHCRVANLYCHSKSSIFYPIPTYYSLLYEIRLAQFSKL